MWGWLVGMGARFARRRSTYGWIALATLAVGVAISTSAGLRGGVAFLGVAAVGLVAHRAWRGALDRAARRRSPGVN